MGRFATQLTRLILSTSFFLSVATVCCAQQPATRIEHLLQAVVHLEQAGMPEQAAEIRELLAGQDEQVKRCLLEEKLAQIQQLRVECAQLQQALDDSDDRTKVILRLKVLELSLDKLSQVGLNFVSIRQLVESKSPTTTVDAGGDIIQFLEMLQSQGFAEVIAEPILITRDGRRASLKVGSPEQADSGRQIIYADPAAFRRATRGSLYFECTPTVGQLGLMQLDLVFRRSGESATTAPDNGDATTELHELPRPVATPQDSSAIAHEHSNSVHTRVEILAGQTLIMAVRESSEQANQSLATLLLLEFETVAPAREQ